MKCDNDFFFPDLRRLDENYYKGSYVNVFTNCGDPTASSFLLFPYDEPKEEPDYKVLGGLDEESCM